MRNLPTREAAAPAGRRQAAITREPSTSAPVPAAAQRHVWARRSALNWRLFAVRVLAAGVAVVLTVLLVPGLGFTGWRTGTFLLVAVVYAMLVAVVKPLLEFVSLRFLVATYGVVVIVANGFLLYLLVRVLPGVINYDRLWQLMLGGFVVGVLGLILETVLGATPPVVDRQAEGPS